MIKKIRRRFVLTGMAATFVMTMTLILALNLANKYFTEQRLGEAISEVAAVWQEDEHDNASGKSRGRYSSGLQGKDADSSLLQDAEENSSYSQGSDENCVYGQGYNKKGKNHKGRLGAYAQYQGRAFSVFLSDDGDYTTKGFNRDILSGIELESLLEMVEKSQKKEGYVDDFRFLSLDQDDGRLYIFLDCYTEARAQRTLWAISFGIALLGLAGAFVFISHMSGRSTRPLEESLEKQKRFITDAGHELKTPLAVIGTNMDVLSLDLGENEWVEGTKRQVKKLKKLVANLITLSRMEEGQYTPAIGVFDLSGAVEECVTPFSDLAAAKGKYLHQEIAEGLSFTGDEAALRQMITILCDNAVKYALPQEEISVRLRKDQKRIYFETENAWDHAVPAGELDRLFDRFYRADSSRSRGAQQESYGLGLSIAQAIAEKNRITLKVFENEKGRLVFQAAFKKAL